MLASAPTGDGPKTERLAFRGGPYYDGAGAGLFTLGLYVARTMRIRYRGFRPAFAPRRQKPHGYGREDGTGAKGGRFRPTQRGNNISPTRPVDNESGVGQIQCVGVRPSGNSLKNGAAG